MKIGFKPQSLLKNLVSEHYADNGNTLKRIIEIPANKPKTLEITYNKTNFIPTQWYVSNYNVISRNSNSTVEKSMKSTKSFPDEIHTEIQRYDKKGEPEQLNIDIADGKVIKSVKTIDCIERTGI